MYSVSYRWAFLESTEISASEDLNALEKAPPQIMPLQILSRKGQFRLCRFGNKAGNAIFSFGFARVTEVRHMQIANYSLPPSLD